VFWPGVPGMPLVAVPPPPPPTDAHAAKMLPMQTIANVRRSCVMYSSFALSERSLMYGFNHQRYALTAADARRSQPIAFSLGPQCMQ